MPRISSIKTDIVQTRLADEGFSTTYGREPAIRHHVLVWISTDIGITGLGEACPLPFTPDDDYDLIRRVIDEKLGPLLIGNDPFDIGAIHNEIDNVLMPGRTALAGVDLALYDLMGKIRGVPVYQLLGGMHREAVEIAEVLGIGSVSSVVETAVKSVESGAKAVKIKVGLDAERDIETLERVRDAVGDSINLRADANAGYSVKTALEVLERIDGLGIEYLEQPVAADDIDGFRQLRASSSTPIMADESLQTYEDAQKLIHSEAVDFFGLKLIKHGGLYEASRIASLALENEIECVIISPWETQIGVAAAVHLVLSGLNFNHPHEIGTRSLQDAPVQGLVEDGGVIQPPIGTGLGVTLLNRNT